VAHRFVFAALAAASCLAQAPAGRWDGSVELAGLKVPFTVQFENGSGLAGSFARGEARVSYSGSFDAGSGALVLKGSGVRFEGRLADGVLKGTHTGPLGTSRFTASAYCTGSYDGEAGPDIAGEWTTDAGWRVWIRRSGEDTLVTVSRREGAIGPLAGRYNGAYFDLAHFDGQRGALLEIEPRKDGSLDLVWKEPRQEPVKLRAAKAAAARP